jgi:hypothetical protein
MKYKILMIMLVFSVCLTASEANKLLHIKQEHSIWYPNTTSHNTGDVFQNGNTLYFAADSGLAAYNISLDSLYVHQLPSDFYVSKGSFGITPARISSIIKLDNFLWCAIPDEGVWFFDFKSKRFTGKLDIPISGFINRYERLTILKDPYENTIWISFSGHLYTYETNNNILTNLNDVCKDLGLTPPNGIRAHLFDESSFWFSSGEGYKTYPALVRYDKELDEFEFYRNELTDYDTKSLYALSLFEFENSLYFYTFTRSMFCGIAEFDKLSKTWENYSPMDLPKVIKDMRTNLSKQQFNSIMQRSFFIKALKKHKKTKNYGIHSKIDFYNEETEELISYYESMKDFKQMQWLGLKDIPERYLYENKLILNNKKNHPNIIHFTEEPIEFYYIITKTKDKLILITNNGLEALDLTTHEITAIVDDKKYKFSKGDSTGKYCISGNHLYIHTKNHLLKECEYILKINLNSLNATDILPEGGVKYRTRQEDIWFSNDTLFANTSDGIRKFHNGTWKECSEGDNPEIKFKHYNTRLQLSNGDVILVLYSGLMLTTDYESYKIDGHRARPYYPDINF